MKKVLKIKLFGRVTVSLEPLYNGSGDYAVSVQEESFLAEAKRKT